ncbi:trehalose-phosphatase [Actinomadura chokoriensis]|uniref:trehalose-phosphatase n=1 Tax=Actinomadura chokoriensis TaxID=454156 RepID=UPI0031F79172
MTPIILTGEGLRAWQAIKKDPRQVGVVLDLDGSLWRSVQYPNRPDVDKRVPDTLRKLNEQVGSLGFLTGRSVEQVRSFLGDVSRFHVLGQFGAEYAYKDDHDLWVPVPPGLAEARTRLGQVLREAQLEGVTVEDVKSHMVAVHLPPGLDPADVADLVEAIQGLALATGLAFTPGHGVVEIGPPGVNKEWALKRFVSGRRRKLSTIMYVGDSGPDLRAFDALDRLRTEEGGQVSTLKVCASDHPKLTRRADAVVDGPVGTVELLLTLVEITAP